MIDNLDKIIIRLKPIQNNINENITLVVKKAEDALDNANRTFEKFSKIKALVNEYEITFNNEIKSVR